jgi:hypothetical protein
MHPPASASQCACPAHGSADLEQIRVSVTCADCGGHLVTVTASALSLVAVLDVIDRMARDTGIAPGDIVRQILSTVDRSAGEDDTSPAAMFGRWLGGRRPGEIRTPPREPREKREPQTGGGAQRAS